MLCDFVFYYYVIINEFSFIVMKKCIKIKFGC